MEFNRNQYLMAGLVLFLLGVQLRSVDAFVLNERASQFVVQRVQQMKGQQTASAGSVPSLMAPGKQRIQRPKWLGYSVISVGGVLVLYSLALKKPGV